MKRIDARQLGEVGFALDVIDDLLRGGCVGFAYIFRPAAGGWYWFHYRVVFA